MPASVPIAGASPMVHILYGISSRCRWTVRLTALVLGATCWPAVHAQDWRDGVAVSDSSAQLLTRKYDGDFTMAAVPPRVDFALVNLTAYGSGTPWGGWGECTWGPDSCFYFCVGNHKGGSDATALLVRYNPRTRTQTVLVNTRTVCQWADYGDGKIHGQPDISPTGDAWLLTFSGHTPPGRNGSTNTREGA